MKYNIDIDYNKKIEEVRTTNNNEITRLKKQLESLKKLRFGLERIKEYEIEKIMPVFCSLISEMEGKKFRWGEEYFLIRNSHAPAYAQWIVVLYLIDEKSDFDKYSFRKCKAPSLEKFWDAAQDYVKVFYRNIEVQIDAYNDGAYPNCRGKIDFSKNNQVKCDEWGCASPSAYSVPYYSSINNPNFEYLLEFINYCSYWRTQETYDQFDLYEKVEDLVPSFVKEYKRKAFIKKSSDTLRDRNKNQNTV